MKRKAPRINRTKPDDLSKILSQTLKRKNLDHKLKQYAFFQDWSEILGEKLGKVTKPEKILYGRLLVVQVSNTALLQELALKKQEILALVRAHRDAPVVEDIRFVLRGPLREKSGK
ncbi:DUF721 domain-containing protein [bacterium]|nr:DUF721 domain-containing protein [bacterium]